MPQHFRRIDPGTTAHPSARIVVILDGWILVATLTNPAGALSDNLEDFSNMSHNGYPLGNPSRPGCIYPHHSQGTYQVIFGRHKKGGFHALQPILCFRSHSRVNHLCQKITFPSLRRQDTEQLSRLLQSGDDFAIHRN